MDLRCSDSCYYSASWVAIQRRLHVVGRPVDVKGLALSQQPAGEGCVVGDLPGEGLGRVEPAFGSKPLDEVGGCELRRDREASVENVDLDRPVFPPEGRAMADVEYPGQELAVDLDPGGVDTVGGHELTRLLKRDVQGRDAKQPAGCGSADDPPGQGVGTAEQPRGAGDRSE